MSTVETPSPSDPTEPAEHADFPAHAGSAQQPVEGAASVPSPRPSSEPRTRPAGGARDQYIDGLRALALVRVLLYHSFGWIWLPIIFPSMGVMFALGGSLVAASLSRTPGRHWVVLRKRVRRLLPPLWLYGAVLVAVMAYRGWVVTETEGSALTWRTALNWLVPLSDPPGSAWGYDFVLPLWYIRTYLWFLLLSPTLLWLFRRYPKPTLAGPPLLLVACATRLIDPDTDTGDTINHLGIFGACWLLGFAHHDGLVRRLPLRRSVFAGLGLMLAGLAFAATHRQSDTGWDIDNIDPANMLYCAGAVLLLLRLYPKRTFLERTPWLSKLVTAMNARAMTIYLWGNFCIWASIPVIESNRFTLAWESGSPAGLAFGFLVTCLVLVATVLAFGWAEDVAAGRPARINPWPRAGERPSAQAKAAASEPGVRSFWRKNAWLAGIGTALTASVAVALAVGPVTHRPVAASIDSVPVAVAALPGLAPVAVRTYPVHLGIAASVLRIGAVAQQDTEDGQSVTSSWDMQWAKHFGGCDGLGDVGAGCGSDQAARIGPDWFPTVTTPLENPYYVGLPYNDLGDGAFAQRSRVPWASDPGYAAHRSDPTVSLMKNRWVKVTGPGGACFAQVEDTGPGPVDPDYVLGTAAPASAHGISLSPALYRCVGLSPAQEEGTVGWQFVDAPASGPWTRIITTRQVS